MTLHYYATKRTRSKKVRGWKNKQRIAVRVFPLDNPMSQSQSIIVRPMILDDIPELAELYRQFWGHSSDVPKMIELMERLLPREEYIFLSAVEDGKLVGSVYGIVCEQPYGSCKPFLVLHCLIVDQDHRQKGVASLLFAELEYRAREKGCIHCDLITYADNEAACSFYRACGFPTDTAGFRKTLR
jgi:ribosomal protein S18 acetylase RimI-like enzyme